MNRVNLSVAAAALACLTGCMHPPPAASRPGEWPRVIPTVDGAVYIPSELWRSSYDNIGYAPARRAGDTVFLSGMIVGRAEGEGSDVAAFKEQARRTFRNLGVVLEAAGLGFENVAMINTFHVWDTPHFSGSRDDQINALAEVKGEFMREPHPAWTAVGTTGLLSDAGIVEIQLIAHAPPRGAQPSRPGDPRQ